MIESSNIALLVKETRKRLGLTQTQWAKRLGVSYQSVNRWENGKTKPLPLALRQIKQELHKMGSQGEDLLDKYFSD